MPSTTTATAPKFPQATPAQLAQLAAADARVDEARTALRAARSLPTKAEREAAEDAAYAAWEKTREDRAAVAATFPSTVKASLTRAYGPHAADVLTNGGETSICVEIGTEKGTRYAFVRPAPTIEEYKALRDKKYTTDAESLVSDAFSSFETLGEEIRSWYDNLPESFQQGDKGSTLDDTATELEDIAGSAPTIPETISAMPVLHLPHKASSRSEQCSEARSMLANVSEAARAALDALTAGAALPEWIEAPDGLLGLDDADPAVIAFRKTVIDEIEELADACDEYGDRADGIEFPGMY